MKNKKLIKALKRLKLTEAGYAKIVLILKIILTT